MPLESAKQIISENIYMTIASASSDGKPWISPVFFAYDEFYNLYWVSNKHSKHSTLIRSNPDVAIVIFDSRAPEGEGDGVYFEAVVEEARLEDEEIFVAFLVRATKDSYSSMNFCINISLSWMIRQTHLLATSPCLPVRTGSPSALPYPVQSLMPHEVLPKLARLRYAPMPTLRVLEQVLPRHVMPR